MRNPFHGLYGFSPLERQDVPALKDLPTNFLGINDILDPTSKLPEAPPPARPTSSPEIYLPSDGAIGDGYEVILDVPPKRLDAFDGPAMQPFRIGELSQRPVLSSMPFLWGLGAPGRRSRKGKAFL